MQDLNFDKEICLSCSSNNCLSRCQYIMLDEDEIKKEKEKIIKGKDSIVLHQCVTCYGCEEYCEYSNHPFYLIVEQQEKLDIPPVPYPMIKRAINIARPFRGEPEFYEVNGPVVNMCAFGHLSSLVSGKLFDGVSVISNDTKYMFHYFCQLMYLHYARHSVIKQRLPKVIENIARHKPTEVICFHDECYGAYTSYCNAYGIEVPFKPVHIFEFLYNRLLKLKDQISPVNIKAAYQRPCSSRLSPDKHIFVKMIFDLIGIINVNRKYSDENSLCCGRPIQGQRKKGSRKTALEIQKKNVEDMKEAGAEICVFSCPTCYETLKDLLKDYRITPVYMVDLCKLAIGEDPVFWR